MKKKLFKMMMLTFTMTMLMAGCGAKEEAQEREEKKEQQVEMESEEEVQEDSEVAEPTEEPEEELTKLGGDEYVDNLFIKLSECESYLKEDHFYRRKAMDELVQQLKTFEFISDVCFAYQEDYTVVIEFTYANGMEGRFHVDYECPEEDKALYEDWSEIERLIDLEISKWKEYYDPQGYFDFSLQAHAKDSLKKGRVTSYNITDTGVTFVGRSGIEYHYEYRGYVDNYLKELYTTEVHPGDEYTRRKEMNEK